MRNFASFANLAISTTEMLNIEGGAAPVFGDSTVTLNNAPLLFEDIQLANEITFGAPKVIPAVTSVAISRVTPVAFAAATTPVRKPVVAPKVKKVSYASNFAKCFCTKG
jgi:hypothetical protein